MREYPHKVDMWNAKPEFIKCITTNGIVKRNGKLVMGRGIALQANKRYPRLASFLGHYVRTSGNMVYYFKDFNIASFPTKNDWRDKSDIQLIRRSCVQLSALLEHLSRYAILPRPGCSNGGLDWESEVRPAVLNVLSDRVWVITR